MIWTIIHASINMTSDKFADFIKLNIEDMETTAFQNIHQSQQESTSKALNHIAKKTIIEALNK